MKTKMRKYFRVRISGVIFLELNLIGRLSRDDRKKCFVSFAMFEFEFETESNREERSHLTRQLFDQNELS